MAVSDAPMIALVAILLIILSSCSILCCVALFGGGTTPTPTASATTTPGITTPAITTPAVTTPRTTTPAVTTPWATTPAVTTPWATTPAVTTPWATTPAVTTPAVTTPWTTTPWATTPAATTPVATTPAATTPPTAQVTFEDYLSKYYNGSAQYTSLDELKYIGMMSPLSGVALSCVDNKTVDIYDIYGAALCMALDPKVTKDQLSSLCVLFFSKLYQQRNVPEVIIGVIYNRNVKQVAVTVSKQSPFFKNTTMQYEQFRDLCSVVLLGLLSDAPASYLETIKNGCLSCSGIRENAK